MSSWTAQKFVFLSKKHLIIVEYLGSWDQEESLKTILVDVSSQQSQLNNLRFEKKKENIFCLKIIIK